MIGLIGWAELGTPFHWAGALIFISMALLGIPLLLMILVFGVPTLVSSLWPRRWRKWYRDQRPREEQRSSYIPEWLRRAVLAADRYACIYCGSQIKPQIDHRVPWSIGGLTALWNLMVLCAAHNRVKSNYWVSPHGKAYYRPWKDAADQALAADILRVERWRRLNPIRWLRAARSLGWLF